MKQNAHERLKADQQTAAWWQEILNDPRFGLVIEAAKSQLEQSPPTFPLGTNPLETMALAHAAGLGVKAALDVLDTLGSTTLTEARLAEERLRAAQHVTAPAVAGTGPGRTSPPPPEIAAPSA